MLEAVTFDFWNTLFREPPGAPASRLRVERMAVVMREFGCEIESSTLLTELRRCWEYATNLQYYQGLDFRPEEHVRKFMADLGLPDSPELEAKLYRAYTEVLLDAPPLMVEGALEVIVRLAEKYLVGLICNTGATPGSVLRQIMARAGLLPYFSTLTFSNEVYIAKPNPAIFQLTLDKMGVVAARSIHIGDDPISDIAGALSAGMRAIWVKRPGAVEEEGKISQQVERVQSLTEILNLIG